MKILITGGAGFIGSHLTEYCIFQNHEVIVLDNLRTGKRENLPEHPRLTFYEGSVTDKSLLSEILHDVDAVVHLAAIVSVPESFENPSECFEVNTLGLMGLLEIGRRKKLKKIVYASSAAVYGDAVHTPIKITTPAAPLSPYGFAKKHGEDILAILGKEYGIAGVAMRYFNVYGPRQSANSSYASAIPIFISRALKNEDIIIFGDGSQTRDFIFVDDIVKYNYFALINDITPGVYNIGTGNSPTVLETAKLILQLSGSKGKIRFTSGRKGDIVKSEIDPSETFEAFGFMPEYSLKQGLIKTLRTYDL